MPSNEHGHCCTQCFEENDEVNHKTDQKLGYVVRISPLGAKDAVVIQWDGENSTTAYFGNDKCENIEKTGNKRIV